jgi:hypothetical protein
MAKRKVTPASQRNTGGETSTVLIFFLVFSILLNLGLGVATYFGFQHDKTIADTNKDLDTRLKDRTEQSDWYRFQALSYRAYMGQLKDPKEFVALDEGRQKFDRNQLGTKFPDYADVSALIKTALEKDRNLRTDPTLKPPQNYEALLDAEKKKNEGLMAQVNQLRVDKDKAEAGKKNAQDELAAEIQKNKEELLKRGEEHKNTLNQYLVSVDNATKELQNQSKAAAEQKTTDDTEKRKIDQRLTVANATIDGLKKRVGQQEAYIARLEKDLGKDVPTSIKMDWRIVSIDKNGTTAHINLGSADKVTSGLSFRIHGIGEDGQAKPRDKAFVEVLNVVDDHLSQVRVLYDYDERMEPKPQRHNPRRDPVLKGDVLYNPTWDPNQKKHVAIAGGVDLVGDGRDSLPEFLRTLERQNIVVDAYFDTKDFTIKGHGIDVNTDLLIIGPMPRNLLDPRGQDKEIRDKLEEGIRTMRNQAKDNGVKVRGLRQYLEEIGYRVPRGLSDEGAYVPSAKTPNGEPTPPPKPDAPPMKPDNPPK